MQDTCAKVLAKPRADLVPGDALPYLLRVLRNTFVSCCARGPAAADRAAGGLRGAPGGAGSASPVAVVAAREVLAAIAALPQDQREVIAAVDIAGLSYGEAAEALGVRRARS